MIPITTSRNVWSSTASKCRKTFPLSIHVVGLLVVGKVEYFCSRKSFAPKRISKFWSSLAWTRSSVPDPFVFACLQSNISIHPWSCSGLINRLLFTSLSYWAYLYWPLSSLPCSSCPRVQLRVGEMGYYGLALPGKINYHDAFTVKNLHPNFQNSDYYQNQGRRKSTSGRVTCDSDLLPQEHPNNQNSEMIFAEFLDFLVRTVRSIIELFHIVVAL